VEEKAVFAQASINAALIAAGIQPAAHHNLFARAASAADAHSRLSPSLLQSLTSSERGHPADRTYSILLQPLVELLRVERVQTRQTLHLLDRDE
jgi:hypothetical protein